MLKPLSFDSIFAILHELFQSLILLFCTLMISSSQVFIGLSLPFLFFHLPHYTCSYLFLCYFSLRFSISCLCLPFIYCTVESFFIFRTIVVVQKPILGCFVLVSSQSKTLLVPIILYFLVFFLIFIHIYYLQYRPKTFLLVFVRHLISFFVQRYPDHPSSS